MNSMNSNNDSDNFSVFPAEQVATPVPESPDKITEESQEDSTYISITENGDNSGKLKVFTYIYMRQ